MKKLIAHQYSIFKQSKTLSDVEKAYLAGLFDGEGCIFISRYISKNEKHKNPIYSLRVLLSQSNEEFIVWIHNTIGFGIINSIKPAKLSDNLQWQWIASQREAVIFLKEILDYLQIKKKQAEIAIEFIEMGTKRVGKYGKVSSDMILRRDEIYNELKELKNIGKSNRKLPVINVNDEREEQSKL